VDDDSFREGKTSLKAGEQIIEAECTHIIPFSLGKFNAQKANETAIKATIWWTLYRYFPILEGNIDASTVNQPGNAVTLMVVHHKRFGKLRLRFWPVEGTEVCFGLSTPVL
jgi:hypothetical protein